MTDYKLLNSTEASKPDTSSQPIAPSGPRLLNGGAGKARWAAAAAKINMESKPMTLAEVVQAKVRLNRWEKMKRGLIKRYSTINVVSRN